ncbi:MAG: gamma-glutamyl-gamma-aminobutyrate hydrolase family protein [Alphaproteobacteria bacterium]|jgi:putative glutamine amidotransferase
MSDKPLIGLTLDSEDPGGYSNQPWYALRQNYFSAVRRAGGLPVALPHEPDDVAAYLARLDGLLVTGGAFDVDPALFGDNHRHASVVTKAMRTEFELAACRMAGDTDMPLLGICGGQQVMNVAFGGTLIQHIPETVTDALAHEQPNPRTQAGHKVTIMADTLLHGIVGVDEMAVNSAHHQAVATVPDGLVVDAVAPDGVIEGIEVPGQRFCLGVQWHPEYAISDGDSRIFDAFVAAAAAG